MKILSFIITILFFFSCSEIIREEITERYQSGNKKILIKYKGEGSNEIVIERIYYNNEGDTLYIENTSDGHIYHHKKEEVTKLYSDGQTEKLLKLQFTMKDDINDYEITDKYVFDENGRVVFHENILQDTFYIKTLSKITQKFPDGNTKEIIKYQKKYDLIKNEILFTTRFNENGDTISHFSEWRKDGFQRVDSEDGMTYSIISFNDYKRNYTVFHSNGQIKEMKSDDYWTEYYRNGRKKFEGRFIDYTKDGKWMYYYENGQIESVGQFLNNSKEGKWTYYQQNGVNKSVGNYNDNDKDGRWIYFDKKGNEEYWEDWSFGTFEGTNRTGEIIFYYIGTNQDTKIITEKINFKNGIKNGKYYSYNTNGSLEVEGQYKNDVKVGIWNYYNENGIIRRTKEWKDGNVKIIQH